VTIPVHLRKKYGIREGMKLDVTESDTGKAIVLKPVPGVKDWAGADTGKYSYSEAVEKLDRLRRKWR
jgi:bifunctional DNA-binding transcriptional regulator/antitoxin component of YhaV-PrlF toxin-antitoxin module